MTTSTALLCLALNIYHEARGEPAHGQVAVAMVTMNRAAWKSENVCRVVYKPGQFSWTHAKRDTTPREPQAWQRAQSIAKRVLDGEHPDITLGATHFHARRISPAWSQAFEKTVRIGDHIFYMQK